MRPIETQNTTGTIGDVPTEVFRRFLETAAAAGGETEMLERLEKTLLEEHRYSEVALELAIFGELATND